LIICSSLMISSIGVKFPGFSVFARSFTIPNKPINPTSHSHDRQSYFTLPWLIYSIPFGVSCWLESPHQVHLVSHKSSGLGSSTDSSD
jgi:hypothetical protein